jgi:soluble lytic murein transglycosylase-like protein
MSIGEPSLALGLRHSTDRRTHGERRSLFRGPGDRRRSDRRRSTLRSLVLSVLTLAAPPALQKATGLPLIPTARTGGRVTVSMDDFKAISPAHAYDHIIAEAAAMYSLEPALIRSVVRAESGFNPFAVSRVGAMGLMQLMPDVAEELGVTDPFDPRQNIMGGSRLLRDLLDRSRGNIAITLASYNAGPGAVAIYHGRVPPFRETREYVKRITGWLAQERESGN